MRIHEAEQLSVEGTPTSSTAAMPDYLLEPNAVLLDNCRWRQGHVPDYTKANENFEKGKTVTHKAGSLGDIVSNLVKNWEKEMSYKTHADDIRTIDTQNYKFSVNGGVVRGLTEMLKIGTYSALIGDQALFCSSKLSKPSSHCLLLQVVTVFGAQWFGCVSLLHDIGRPASLQC
ncbi:hypothetical protein ABBQ38_006791 [Trebouxia sp. C0009 RCD-2024]